jgi:hypothetical protein
VLAAVLIYSPTALLLMVQTWTAESCQQHKEIVAYLLHMHVGLDEIGIDSVRLGALLHYSIVMTRAMMA